LTGENLNATSGDRWVGQDGVIKKSWKVRIESEKNLPSPNVAGFVTRAYTKKQETG